MTPVNTSKNVRPNTATNIQNPKTTNSKNNVNREGRVENKAINNDRSN